MQKSRSIGISTSKGLYICKSKSLRLESHYIVNTSPFLSVSLSLRARIECHKPTNCERHYCEDHPENGRHNQIEETYTCWSDQNYSHLMNMTMITKVQWSDHHERWWFIWLHLNGCNTTNTKKNAESASNSSCEHQPQNERYAWVQWSWWGWWWQWGFSYWWPNYTSDISATRDLKALKVRKFDKSKFSQDWRKSWC